MIPQTGLRAPVRSATGRGVEQLLEWNDLAGKGVRFLDLADQFAANCL
jgi:hypothetical protein